MSPAEVTEKLGLHRMRDRLWYVHPRYVISLFSLGRLMLTPITVALPPVKDYSRACSGCPTLSADSHKSRGDGPI